MKTLVALAITFLSPAAPAQLLLSTANASGVGAQVFEQRTPGGAFSQINTGFAEANYASLSRDGRFIHFSSPDPTGAVTQILPSSDIYRFDRATGQSTKVFDYTTMVDNNQNQATVLPEFNALSPDGRYLVASVRGTVRQGIANPQRRNNLGVFLSGGTVGVIENGRGSRHDFEYAEFTGISWAPDSRSFVTPGYFIIAPGNPNTPPAVGIVRFALDGQGEFVRTGVLSVPTLVGSPDGSFSASIQIFPALSPSGRALAYFDLAWFTSIQGRGPTTTRLITANADGSNATVRATFGPGTFPLGLTWAPDGSQLVFSISPQLQQGGRFLPGGNPAQASVQSIASFGGDTTLRRVSNGFLPSFGTGGAGPATDLAQIPLNLSPAASGNGFTFSATGLDPAANYILESSATLSGNFVNPATFTGAQLMGGVPITRNGDRAFFRLRQPD